MPSPLIPDDSPRAKRLQRRAKAIVIELVAFVLVTLTFPLLVAAAAVVDLVKRKPLIAVRLVAMLWWFLLGELRGLVTLAAIYLASAGRDSRTRRFRVYRLRQRWIGGHLDGVSKLFRLKYEIEGLDEVAPGPVVILMRHASIIDNALPDALVGRRHDLGLRFVIKRELQALPTIDIGGRWVPTNFVRRGTGDTATELEDLRKLTIDVDPQEGILIYPEGTRATKEKIAKAQAVIRERRPELSAKADQLRHVLPPRLGGPLELLTNTPGVDVVVCAHAGFDGYETVGDIWNGRLLGQTIKVRFQRFAAADVPRDPEALTGWLYDRWLEVDEFIDRTGTTTP